jgi:hypothetical protein
VIAWQRRNAAGSGHIPDVALEAIAWAGVQRTCSLQAGDIHRLGSDKKDRLEAVFAFAISA